MKHLFKAAYLWYANRHLEDHGHAAGWTLQSCNYHSVSIQPALNAVHEHVFQPGEILAHVASDQASLCRDTCDVVFRKVMSYQADARMVTTSLATFAEVFPAETYDPSLADVEIESVLPKCSSHAVEASRQLGLADRFGRKKEYDDDHYNSKDYNSKDKYDDDKIDVEKEDAKMTIVDIWEVTKDFILDVYCALRQIDCTARQSDYDDDFYPTDDDIKYPDSKSGSKDHRKLSSNKDRQLGLFGDRSGPFGFGFLGGTTAARAKYDDDDDHYYSSSESKDSKEDDDDFFNDDHPSPTSAPTPNDSVALGNLFLAVFRYINQLVCIFFGGFCGGRNDDDVLDDDDRYSSSDSKDYHRFLSYSPSVAWSFAAAPARFLSNYVALKTAAYMSSSSFKKKIHTSSKAVPHTTEDWLSVGDDGVCRFTDCEPMATTTDTGFLRSFSQNQCFTNDVSDDETNSICSHTMEAWFASSSSSNFNKEDCSMHEYCYASSSFDKATCDRQLHSWLQQTCPTSSGMMVLPSNASPLSMTDIQENCPLSSVLLYLWLQEHGMEDYNLVQEKQGLYEKRECR